MEPGDDLDSGKTVTIHDVARHAGVSRMTVSRVMNADAKVRAETRVRVQASIDALDYAPNAAARSLAGARGYMIGLYYTSSTATFLTEIVIGSLMESNRGSCRLVLEQCDDADSERTALSRLGKSGINGVILPPPLSDSDEALTALRSAGVPAVLITSGRPVPDFSSVSIDDRKAAHEMTRHLIGQGHTRIGFINGHPGHGVSSQRFRGFMDAMKEAGIPVIGDQIVQGFFTYRSGLEAAESLLTNGFNPTAIFACNDDMAAATMAVAHRMGLNIPADISVAGFDDTPLATMVWPELTTIRRPIGEMAKDAVRLLIQQVGGKAKKAPQHEHRMWNFNLVVRGSTGPAPSQRNRISRGHT